MEPESTQHNRTLSPYLSQAGAWAFALGTSIGWGSLVVTSNTYLLQAGPWGSVLGLLVGAAAMVVIARNYHYMINCFPDAGGAYTYAKEIFGHDFGFLTAWFLNLTYIAMLWANATSLPLFAHYFLGDALKFGYLYTVFGYDVYVGEALLTIGAIALVGLFCARSRKGVMYAMIGLAALLTCGIAACFLAAAGGFAGQAGTVDPGFLPDKAELSQVLLIACISPWAFIGFENISHSSEEFAFPRSKVFRIMVAAIVTATVLYAFVLLLSVMAYPPEYGSWLEYISDLGNLDGIKGLPPFYVAHHYLGDTGVRVLMAVLLALVFTSLIGNIVALSRLFHALAKDDILPGRFEAVNVRGVPGRAIALVAVLSLVIPFLGRTAIGWIVDVTTIGATIIYGFVSASTAKIAKSRDDGVERVTGIVGTLLMVACGVYLLLPSLFLSRSLAPESYFLFAAWGILGFIFFRWLLNRDTKRRFGRSVVVWIGLLSLVMFVSFVWMNQSLTQTADDAMMQILAYYQENSEALRQGNADFIAEQSAIVDAANMQTMLIAAALVALASAMLLTNFAYVSKWARESEEELDLTRDIIYYDPLTGLPSMAHFHELAQTGAQAIWSRGKRPAAVALDLMGMKDFSAKNGRSASDLLLCEFANVVLEHFGSESCSRFAEERFYAFAAEDEVEGKIEAVFADFRDVPAGGTLPVSAGVYLCHAHDDIVAVGLDRARAACDVDRKTWQSHITWFNEDMGDEAVLRLHVLDSLEQAIAEAWIRPHYQAVVRAKTRKICGEEALARWVDPEYGFLSPAQFVPVLEEAGLLHKMDMHMIDCVLADMKHKREIGVPVVPASVNISLTDVGQLDIAKEIIARVDAAGVSHDMLAIEFTESAASDDPLLFKTEVDALRAAGFEVWMDDFGSGYSSLNSLKNFDFDIIKLDMDFMRGRNDRKTWDIVSGTVGIVESIGIRSLAEGVENETQAQRLADIGCDMLQGYFFAQPLPLDEVIRRYDNGHGTQYELPGESR